MASPFFDEAAVERYQNFEYDFPSRPLRDKVIVLAGGSGGLGAATAALLAQAESRVVVGYHRNRERAEQMKDALRRYGDRNISLCQADITEEQGRNRLLETAETVGPLFGLVVFTGNPARGTGEEILRASMEINCLAPLLLARQAAERMVAAETPGSIVLFSSMQGGYPFEGSTAYGTAKAALAHGARVLAKESGGKANIRVNVVAPGATLAGMAQASVRSGKYDRFVKDGVIPRFGRAEDMARTVAFLLEPDSYITGQAITVDGGLTLRRDLRDE